MHPAKNGKKPARSPRKSNPTTGRKYVLLISDPYSTSSEVVVEAHLQSLRSTPTCTKDTPMLWITQNIITFSQTLNHNCHTYL